MEIINWVKLNPVKTVLILVVLGAIAYLMLNVKKEHGTNVGAKNPNYNNTNSVEVCNKMYKNGRYVTVCSRRPK